MLLLRGWRVPQCSPELTNKAAESAIQDDAIPTFADARVPHIQVVGPTASGD